MTTVIYTCDFCGRIMNGSDRIYLKRKAHKHGGERNFDICPNCWKLLEKMAMEGLPQEKEEKDE